jgi:hypothetical protein
LAEMLIDLGLQTTRVGQFLPLPKPKHLQGFVEFQELSSYKAGE